MHIESADTDIRWRQMMKGDSQNKLGGNAKLN